MQGQAGNESGETESLRKNQKAIREIKLLTETQAAQDGSNRLASRSDTAKNPRARGYSKEKAGKPQTKGNQDWEKTEDNTQGPWGDYVPGETEAGRAGRRRQRDRRTTRNGEKFPRLNSDIKPRCRSPERSGLNAKKGYQGLSFSNYRKPKVKKKSQKEPWGSDTLPTERQR